MTKTHRFWLWLAATTLILILLFQSASASSVYFPTTTYSGIHISSVSYGGSQNETLSAYVVNATNDSSAWFTVGTKSVAFPITNPSVNNYVFYTSALTPNASGNFSVTITGIPLMPGTQYFVRAACLNGSSPEELNFTLPAISPSQYPTSNYGTYFNNLQNANKNDPYTMMMLVFAPLADVFGGGSIGWNIVWTIMFGVPLIIMAIRHNGLVVLFMVLGLVFSFIGNMILQDLIWIIYAVMVIVAGALLYRFIRRE